VKQIKAQTLLRPHAVPPHARAQAVELLSSYLEIKQAHIGLVMASGLLFSVRGAAVLAGQRWAMLPPWRWLSYGIDTLLLAAGVTLWAVLSLNPVQSPWLGVKLLLLLLYIVLGSLALKRGRTPLVRQLSYGAALATYLFMATVAVKHHPLGLLLGAA
jgi:uncharacterized membrane protein SirB2